MVIVPLIFGGGDFTRKTQYETTTAIARAAKAATKSHRNPRVGTFRLASRVFVLPLAGAFGIGISEEVSSPFSNIIVVSVIKGSVVPLSASFTARRNSCANAAAEV